MATVRTAVFDVLRAFGMTRIFANPGSTEIAFLTDLPDDLEFVLGLHEGSVVGMATGQALATGEPALAVLHTTAGFGNAVGAIATARVNRAPLVVLVGQQDRRHLASEPFLTGHLDGLAGEYPVWSGRPARAGDVPGAVARAWHEATRRRGPAVVVVPMGDWEEPADDVALPAPREMTGPAVADPRLGRRLADLLAGSGAPALVVGAGADDARTWQALVTLAERLGCPVWQESNASRAGFPHDHPSFRGHLPPTRDHLRTALAGHDLVVVVGGPAFRQGTYRPGPFVAPGTRVVVLTGDDEEAAYSAADLAVVGDVPAICADLAERVPARPAGRELPERAASVVAAPAPSEPLQARHVFAALAERLPAESTVLEESPSTRRQLIDLIPARAPFGFLTVAMGGLGFALPGATGVKMACPDRPVVAVVGDGASLYGIQALWSAQRYRVGALFVVLSNGGYAVMDRLAHAHGGKPPWPGFDEVRVSTLAEGLGCPAVRVHSWPELVAELDRVVPTLGTRSEPLLLDVVVTP